jgi:Flp pilus assembly protein TadG
MFELPPAVRRFVDATDGAALVELTLIAPLLVVTSIFMMNFGLLFYCYIQVANAAQAGAQYAMAFAIKDGYSATDISNAATSANASSQPGFFNALSATTTRSCGCPSGSGITTSAWTTSCAVSSTCTDGSIPGTYVTVAAQATYNTFVPSFAFFPASYTLTASSTVRIQ